MIGSCATLFLYVTLVLTNLNNRVRVMLVCPGSEAGCILFDVVRFNRDFSLMFSLIRTVFKKFINDLVILSLHYYSVAIWK